MELRFCRACGEKVTDADLASGRVVKEESGFLCSGCNAAAPTGSSGPVLPTADTTKVASRRSRGATARTKRVKTPERQPARGRRLAEAEDDDEESRPRNGSARGGHYTKEDRMKIIALVISPAILLAIIGVVWLVKRSDSPKKQPVVIDEKADLAISKDCYQKAMTHMRAAMNKTSAEEVAAEYRQAIDLLDEAMTTAIELKKGKKEGDYAQLDQHIQNVSAALAQCRRSMPML